jgi:hypothetical protein
MIAQPLPLWEQVTDPALLAYLRALPAEEQIRLKDETLFRLEHEHGDSIMGQVLAASPLRIPFPPAWESFTDQERDAWRNDIYVPQMRALIAEDVAARRTAEAAA